jgi:hypothetical protein
VFGIGRVVQVDLGQEMTLTAPSPHATSSFLNIRVADIREVYADWSSEGRSFCPRSPIRHKQVNQPEWVRS